MNQRGVFITIMIFMLLSVMLSLAAVGRYYEINAEASLTEIGTGSRVYYRFQNVKDVLLYTLEKIAMPEFEVGGDGVYFFDELPVVNADFSTNKRSALVSNANDFGDFIASYGDDLTVALDFTGGKDFSEIVIEPHNIEYYYPSGQSGKAIEIDPNGHDVAGYDLNFVLLNQDYNSIVWQQPSSPSTTPTPGYDKFILTVYEDTYSNQMFNQTYYLDPTTLNKGYVDTDQPGANDIAFRLSSGSVLKVTGSQSIQADLKIGVLLDEADLNYVDMSLISGTLSVSESAYGYSKAE